MMTSVNRTLLNTTTAIAATTTSTCCDDTPSGSPPLTPTSDPLASRESLHPLTADAPLSSHSSSSPRGFLILPTLARFRLLSTDAIWTTQTTTTTSPPPPASSAITTPIKTRKARVVTATAAAPSPTSQTAPDSLNYSNSATGTTSASKSNIPNSHSAFSIAKRPRPQSDVFRSRSNEILRKSSDNVMSSSEVQSPEHAIWLPTPPIAAPEPPMIAPQSPAALGDRTDHAVAVKNDEETTVSSLSNDSRRRRGIYRAQQQQQAQPQYPALPPHYPLPQLQLQLPSLMGGQVDLMQPQPPFFVHEERFLPPAEIFVPVRRRQDSETLSIPDWLRDDEFKVSEVDGARHDNSMDNTESAARARVMQRRKSPPPPPLDTQGASPVMPRPSFGKHESSLPTDRTQQQQQPQQQQHQRFLGFGGRIQPSQTTTPSPAVTDPSSNSSSTSSVTSLGSTCSAPATIAIAYTANASFDKDEWNNINIRESQSIPLRQRACSTGALLLDQTKNKLVRMASAATRKSGKDLATTVKKVAKSPTKKKPTGLPPLHPSAMPPRPVLTKHKTCPTPRTAAAPGLMGLTQSAQPTLEIKTGGTPTKAGASLPIPARTRAATTGVLHQQPEAGWSFRTTESRDGELPLYHGNDRLLGNRPRRRLPRGTPSVISVGTLVGQSTWLAASPNCSSWSSAGLHHPSTMDHAFPAGDATVLGGDEPTIVMISSASDSPEYHSGAMRANRRLESILDVRQGSNEGRNSRWRKELSYLWQRLSMQRRHPFHHASSSFKRKSHRHGSRPQQGRNQRRQGKHNTDVELLRNSAGCLT